MHFKAKRQKGVGTPFPSHPTRFHPTTPLVVVVELQTINTVATGVSLVNITLLIFQIFTLQFNQFFKDVLELKIGSLSLREKLSSGS